MLNEYTKVQATRNLSSNVLMGYQGTIVFVYNDPRLAYEVEFFDDEGYTLDVLTVLPSDIRPI